MSNKQKYGVVLMQFGGPDSLDAVEPFLFNLFNDADIFELPFGPRFQKCLAKQISSRRSPSVREKYGQIGGKSPIVAKTFEQLSAVERYFDTQHPELCVSVVLAMRYWKPFTEAAIRSLVEQGIKDIVLLPLYAQYSKTNAGSSFNEWDRETKRLGVTFNERRIREYYTDAKYLAALNERIDEGLAQFKNPSKVFLLFSAHGTPIDMVERGDPYARQIRETVKLVMSARDDDHHHTLSFQSKVGPKQWLTPSTTDTLKSLGKLGVTDVLVVPIAFVSDHIETLHELEIEERETAQHAGITNYVVMKGLNDHPLFIECLAELALQEIHHFQSEPITSH